MKETTTFSRFAALFYLTFLSITLSAQTMTFNTCACEPGFSFNGWGWYSAGGDGRAYVDQPNVNFTATITRNDYCFNAVSFQKIPFGGGGGLWKVWDNNGNEKFFTIGGGGVETLNWTKVQWLKFKLEDVGTGGTNNAWDMDNLVYTAPAPVPASTPTVTINPPIICQGQSATLNISGNLNDASEWKIYSGSCGGTAVGSTSGNSFNVNPSTTTTYFVRGEGICAPNGSCNPGATLTVKTFSSPLSTATATPNPSCENDPVQLTASGGTDGTGAVVKWYTGPNGTGTNFATGLGPHTVNPAITTTYYVRREGDCNTTSDKSVLVTVEVCDPCAAKGGDTDGDGVCDDDDGCPNDPNKSAPGNCGCGNPEAPFTVPANGSSTVACPDQVTEPTPPAVNNDCGDPVTPTGPVITEAPDPVTCEGTITYTWAYSNGFGTTLNWNYVYTIERDDFTVPADGASTVACPSLATEPTPPTVMSDCGETITPTGPVIANNPDPIVCEGTRTYTWTYTDCEDNSHTWSHVYTITRLDFTVPTDGASTVACPDLATAPTPPTVMSDCGETLTPTGPVVVNNPNPLVCEGTRTYTWTYTDCAGHSHLWSHVYTISRLNFTVPANGATTVACPSNITQPTPPTVMSNCGETLTPTGPVVVDNPNPITCEGTRTYTWTYTDCAGHVQQWSHVVTVTRLDFTVPANGGSTVACTSAITQPTPPVVTSNCGETLTPTGPVITNNPNPLACEGTRTYTWTFTDCAGHAKQWSYVYTVERLDFTVPPNGGSTVACPAFATVPTPPSVFSDCGENITPTGPVITNNPNPLVCEGTRTYTWTYTDCAGHSHQWSYIYTIDRLDFTVPANGSATVDCPALAVAPSLPTVLSNCGEPITPTGPVIVNNPNPLACQGTRTYTYTYTDCAGHSKQWSFTYTVTRLPFTVPANGTSTVACPANATQPTPPVVLSNCGETITPTGPVVVNNPNPLTCQGTRTYTWTYTDCAGSSKTWSHTYTVVRLPFNVPANGAATVACPANATQPTPPVVLSNCGENITPTGPVVVNNPNPLTCQGTRTYSWTYTDCAGSSKTWSFTYTVVQLAFGIPPNGGSTVACPDATDVTPTPPVVMSNCGATLTPVLTNVTPKVGCEGNRNYTFTYTDCAGNSKQWVYTYIVEYQDFSLPPNATESMECPINITPPTPPVVYDNCNKQLNPSGPVISSTNNAAGCEATRKYSWTYTDCEGNSHAWSYIVTFLYQADFFAPQNEETQVGCALYIVPPVPQTIYDICGRAMSITGPTIEENLDPTGCTGSRKYTYVYSDCGGHSHPWSFTYHVTDNEPPLGTCPSGMVDVTDLSCIEDVPCPTDYDFSSKIDELIAAGNIFDICSGNDLTVELDSWSELWQCSDDDGDNIYTFGRTFYFRIMDKCGNEFPSLCGVTYSGQCLPMMTFTQGDWGEPGGEPGLSQNMTDLQVIQPLLGMGIFKIGGASRSITVSDPQCLVNLLPGLGNPNILFDCHQINCIGCNPGSSTGMKNALAANTMALMLNMRFNVNVTGLTMADIRNHPLDCIEIDGDIKSCAEGLGCKLRIFETNGTQHQFPYTIGGLLDLANLFLNGDLLLSSFEASVIASGLNSSIVNVNAYWHVGVTPTACIQSAGHSITEGNSDKAIPTGKPTSMKEISFSLAPNPAGNEVKLQVDKLADNQHITFELYNVVGQRLLQKDFGEVNYVNERIDLSSIGTGIYFVSVKAGEQQTVKKLLINKE